jgi:hypothetical protein
MEHLKAWAELKYSIWIPLEWICESAEIKAWKRPSLRLSSDGSLEYRTLAINAIQLDTASQGFSARISGGHCEIPFLFINSARKSAMQ